MGASKSHQTTQWGGRMSDGVNGWKKHAGSWFAFGRDTMSAVKKDRPCNAYRWRVVVRTGALHAVTAGYGFEESAAEAMRAADSFLEGGD